jgi:cytochrome c553
VRILARLREKNTDEGKTMFRRLFATAITAGVIFACAGVSANAQTIESKVAICGACHGASGSPTDPKTMPPIWGQQVYYIVKQLSDYRNGEREHPIMSGIAKGLQQADLRPIAVYFAGKTWPKNPAPVASATAPDKIQQCRPCHQQNFEGGAPAPRLAGLSYEYLSAQMNAFANDTRTNNGDMPKIMKALTQAERDAMAKYLAGL